MKNPPILSVSFRWHVQFSGNGYDPLNRDKITGKCYASLVAQMVKSLSAVWETQIRSLGQEDPLEKELSTHSSTLAWKSHGQRSLVGYSPGVTESYPTEAT